MTLKQVLIKAIEIINNGLIDVENSSTELTRLIECGNFIYSELADEYSDLKYSEELVAADGTIPFTSFTKSVKKILKVKYGSAEVPFREYNTYVDVMSQGTYKVDYTYKSDAIGLNDTLDLPAFFTLYSVACGVASEYFFRTGLVEEALFYKNRYDRAVNNLTAERRRSKLKVRRFI